MTWLPADVVRPARWAVPGGHHPRPVTAADTGPDHLAARDSRERPWRLHGEAGDRPLRQSRPRGRDLSWSERPALRDTGPADFASPGTTPPQEGDRP
ncbi:hypothetical protein ACWD48_16005 [Streptomyces sp. NPDC002519]